MSYIFAPTASDWTRWGISAAIVGGFILLALAAKYILTGFLKMLTRRTKTILDDVLIKALTAPVFALFIISGLWIALARLTELANYQTIIRDVFVILYIGLAAITAVRVVRALLAWYGAEVASRTFSDVDDRLVPIFNRVADVIIWAIALLIILAQLHINISPILAGLGIGGLAVALALQSTLSNFLAGTYVISDSIIRKGHYIMLENGPEGTVEDIGWRTTKIRTWQGNLVILPNAKLSESIVTDFEKPEASMAFGVDCGVSYNSDLNKVERVTLEVARTVLKNNPAGVKDFEPFLRYNKFDDSNINFTVVLKGTDRAAQFILKHELIKQLQARFSQEGIEIDYPVRKLLFVNNPMQPPR